jgi:IS30 family transposase
MINKTTPNKHTLKKRGIQARVSKEEEKRIIELKKTMSIEQIATLLGRSEATIVYAGKKRPDKRERNNWLV